MAKKKDESKEIKKPVKGQAKMLEEIKTELEKGLSFASAKTNAVKTLYGIDEGFVS